MELVVYETLCMLGGSKQLTIWLSLGIVELSTTGLGGPYVAACLF